MAPKRVGCVGLCLSRRNAWVAYPYLVAKSRSKRPQTQQNPKVQERLHTNWKRIGVVDAGDGEVMATRSGRMVEIMTRAISILQATFRCFSWEDYRRRELDTAGPW